MDKNVREGAFVFLQRNKKLLVPLIVGFDVTLGLIYFYDRQVDINAINVQKKEDAELLDLVEKKYLPFVTASAIEKTSDVLKMPADAHIVARSKAMEEIDAIKRNDRIKREILSSEMSKYKQEIKDFVIKTNKSDF